MVRTVTALPLWRTPRSEALWRRRQACECEGEAGRVDRRYARARRRFVTRVTVLCLVPCKNERVTDRDLLRRLDCRLERMDKHLERGNELMGETRTALDRDSEAFDRNTEASDRNIEAADRLLSALDDQRTFTRDMLTRFDHVVAERNREFVGHLNSRNEHLSSLIDEHLRHLTDHMRAAAESVRAETRLTRLEMRETAEAAREAREESRAVVQAIFKLIDKLDRRLPGNGPATA